MLRPDSGLDRRRIDPELLDSLPAHDPRAIGSRRDLVWINALMLQSTIMARLLKAAASGPPASILEIGAGDGTFMLSVARRLKKVWSDVDLVVVDLADLVTGRRREEFARLGWRVRTVEADIFDWIGQPSPAAFDVVVANLFLHHFSDARLKGLFRVLHELAPVFVATEPRRNAVALQACSLLRLIGANDVTLHDAAASVRAGFAGKELSSLWPSTSMRRCEEHEVGPFTHAFRVVNQPVEMADDV